MITKELLAAIANHAATIAHIKKGMACIVILRDEDTGLTTTCVHGMDKEAVLLHLAQAADQINVQIKKEDK